MVSWHCCTRSHLRRSRVGTKPIRFRYFPLFGLEATAAWPFAFFLADPLGSGSLRLAEVMEPVTLKKSSSRLLTPFLILSSLNCFSPHKKLTSPSSSGSAHFSSTVSGSITLGSKKSCWASLCSQFSGTEYFFESNSTARLGPIPRMLSQ
uniref:Uncharacterized protein n=1 Tax=Salvator merianae TaxID=96440 RepID=A0A8D0BE61_SALMN